MLILTDRLPEMLLLFISEICAVEWNIATDRDRGDRSRGVMWASSKGVDAVCGS